MSKRGKRHHKTSRLDPALLEQPYEGRSQSDIDVSDQDGADVPQREGNNASEPDDANPDR